MKKLTLLLICLTFNLQATMPENMPQTVYDGIVNQVIADVGHYDAVLVEQAVSQWLLDQPLPASDGELIESGACQNCVADNQGTDAQLPQARNVKIKAKKKNGAFTNTYKIKWKRPTALADDSPYQLSHYNVYVGKDGENFKTYQITPKFKRNGQAKKKNTIKFKDSQHGNHSVQVQAVYAPAQTANKSAGNQVKAVDYVASGWTNQKLYSLQKHDLYISDLTGSLKNCLNAAGYGDNTLLKIFTKIDCREQNLTDADIVQIEDFTNLRSLIIDNNPNLNNIAPLQNLPYLTFLSLSGNKNINLDFTKIIELEDLYLADMGLSTLPNLAHLTELEFLDLSDNQIANGFANNLPQSLTTMVLDNNSVEGCAGLAGKEIESLQLKGDSITTFADCAGVIGLRNLSINGAPNLSGIHDINAFGGFCSLTINDSNISQINGSRPIAWFNLENNTKLQKVGLIKLGSTNDNNNYPNLIPQRVSLEGSNNLKCNNYYNKKALWDENNYTSMSPEIVTTVQGSTLTSPQCAFHIPASYTNASVCRPDPVPPFDVYTDTLNNKHFITWKHHAGATTWGVTHYMIYGEVYEAETGQYRKVSYNTVYMSAQNSNSITLNASIPIDR